MTLEAAIHYASTIVDLQLSEEEYQILKKLTELATEYMEARLAAVTPAVGHTYVPIAHRMDNLQYRLQHLAGQPNKETFIEGDVIVLLAQPRALITTNPEASANHEFMRAPQTLRFIEKLKGILDEAHDGFRHHWILRPLL